MKMRAKQAVKRQGQACLAAERRCEVTGAMGVGKHGAPLLTDLAFGLASPPCHSR